MKANGTKRKIFNDAVDLLAGAEEVSAPENGNEKVSSQGRRNDILEEIARLNGRNIARYMRVQKLEEPLKERLDEGMLPLVAAVDLSYLSEREQGVVSGLAESGRIKLDAKTAKCVRGMAGNVTEEAVLGALDSGKGKKAATGRSVRLSAEVYERYFAGVKPADVAGIVEEALAAWFGKGGETDVPREAAVMFHLLYLGTGMKRWGFRYIAFRRLRG